MEVLRITALLLSCFSIVVNVRNVATEDGDPELQAYLREAIENFRKQMPLGIEEIKMPILDPLHLTNLTININENAATLQLAIHEITIKDLSKFVVQDLVPDLETFFLKTALNLPSVTSYGQYKIDGQLFKILPLYGEGNFQINLTLAEIAGQGKLDFMEDTLQMTSLDLDLTWFDLDIYLEHFLGGGRFSEALQKLLPKIGKGAFDTFKPKVMKLINKALANELNKELRKPHVKKIIEGIIPRHY